MRHLCSKTHVSCGKQALVDSNSRVTNHPLCPSLPKVCHRRPRYAAQGRRQRAHYQPFKSAGPKRKHNSMRQTLPSSPPPQPQLSALNSALCSAAVDRIPTRSNLPPPPPPPRQQQTTSCPMNSSRVGNAAYVGRQHATKHTP